jgi:lycopene elongase/hydratase (dihydrobisanhydrobacterioruberin-forming)
MGEPGDLLAVHRLEFPFGVNFFCYATWGSCFAVTGAARLLDLTVLGTVLANLLLITSGLALNTAADLRTDERHAERGRLAGAARRLSRRRILRWVTTEMLVAVLLTGLVAVRAHRPPLVAAAAVIITLHVLYNTEPVRLKRRGLLGVTAFCAAVLVLPFLLSYWAIRPELDAPIRPVVVGLGILAVGRMTLWSVPDAAADTATGMRTPAVRYGPAGALALALAVMIIGLALAAWGLLWRYGPVWTLPPVAVQASLLYGVVLALRHPEDRPTSARIRRRAMPPVTLGMLAMAAIPLIAG